MKVTGKHGQEFERVILALPPHVQAMFEAEQERLDFCPGNARPAEFFDPLVINPLDKLWAAKTTRVDSFAKLEIGQGMTIGEFVHAASFSHLGVGGGVTILEDGSSFASGSRVISGTNIQGRGRSCSATAPGNLVEHSFVWIKRDAVLFAGATVLPGVTIGENSVIGAGALVRCDVPDLEIWAGNPAVKIGEVTGP